MTGKQHLRNKEEQKNGEKENDSHQHSDSDPLGSQWKLVLQWHQISGSKKKSKKQNQVYKSGNRTELAIAHSGTKG